MQQPALLQSVSPLPSRHTVATATASSITSPHCCVSLRAPLMFLPPVPFCELRAGAPHTNKQLVPRLHTLCCAVSPLALPSPLHQSLYCHDLCCHDVLCNLASAATDSPAPILQFRRAALQQGRSYCHHLCTNPSTLPWCLAAWPLPSFLPCSSQPWRHS